MANRLLRPTRDKGWDKFPVENGRWADWLYRDVAQFGSAPDLGSGDPGFKSLHLDHSGLMMEQEDMPNSKFGGAIRVGSTPTEATICGTSLTVELQFSELLVRFQLPRAAPVSQSGDLARI